MCTCPSKLKVFGAIKIIKSLLQSLCKYSQVCWLITVRITLTHRKRTSGAESSSYLIVVLRFQSLKQPSHTCFSDICPLFDSHVEFVLGLIAIRRFRSSKCPLVHSVYTGAVCCDWQGSPVPLNHYNNTETQIRAPPLSMVIGIK